jgi:poly(3-hydroxybutyrate) depolymerase
MLDSRADQAVFAVAYPDELINPSEGGTNWAFFFNDFTDDVGFLRQLINMLQADIHPDPKKIYVTGGSSGAAMSHRLLGGAHEWYLTPINVAAQSPYNPDLNSTTGITTDDILWMFFEAHPKP